MEKYITESLAAGLICASTSPVAAGFFFIEKRDKILRLCIDYRGLNKIMVKNEYPLPLLTSAFELLQRATVFTKLEMPTIWFGYANGTNGRPPSTHTSGTLST